MHCDYILSPRENERRVQTKFFKDRREESMCKASNLMVLWSTQNSLARQTA